MRTIIAGSRSGITYDDVRAAIDEAGWMPTVVLCGDCRGADSFGAQWARFNGIPIEHYPADWRLHGKAAGPKRNMEMAHHAEALIAVWDGKSPGTRSMINAAYSRNLRVYVWKTK